MASRIHALMTLDDFDSLSLLNHILLMSFHTYNLGIADKINSQLINSLIDFND